MIVLPSLFRGVTCGGVGGLFAGALLSLLYALVAGEPYVEAGSLVVFLWTGSWVGLLLGAVTGALVGLTLRVTEPYLERLSQVVGALIVMPLGALLSLSLEAGQWTRVALGAGSGLIVGIIGGTVAFRCYQWLFQYGTPSDDT